MNQSYMLTDSFTLAGTSDEVVFLAVPIVGSDGTFYGVCGYEVSADYFTTYHAQPAAEKRLSCMLLSCKDDTYIPTGLACSGQDNYVEPLSGNIQVSGMPGKLSKISGGSQSFIGTVKEITLTPNNEPFTLAVMIPQSDYSSAVINSIVQFVLLITLLLFFSVSCCLFFSKRYLSPILKISSTTLGAKNLRRYRRLTTCLPILPRRTKICPQYKVSWRRQLSSIRKHSRNMMPHRASLRKHSLSCTV